MSNCDIEERSHGRLGCPNSEGTGVLVLAAAPTFAIMALTSAVEAGPPDLLCSVALHAASLNGMVAMYMLMSVFHLAPWIKLARGT